MNFFRLATIIPIIMLVSCSHDDSLFNKTFTYKNECFYNIDNKLNDFENKTARTIIGEQMTLENINWAESGCVVNNVVIFHFESHDTVNNVIINMEKISKSQFDNTYNNFKIVTSNESTKTATVTLNNMTKTLNMKANNNDQSSYHYYLFDPGSSLQRGYITIPVDKIYGAGVSGGVFNCIEFGFDNTNNFLKFKVTFNKPVYNKNYIEWFVCAKINNQ